jgi:hypothetical protein
MPVELQNRVLESEGSMVFREVLTQQSGEELPPSVRCRGNENCMLRAYARRVNPDKKGKKMTTLRRKVLVLVSAIVVTLALVVLPGCGKKDSPTKKPAPTKTKKDITKGIE